MHTMMLAGATALFVPHAGKLPSKLLAPGGISRSAPTSTASVTTSTEFRLPPELEYGELIREASREFNVSARLIRAVITIESAFDALAVSPAGAQGLMQLMPALCRELGINDPFDPRQNIMGGARYLATLLQMHGGNLELALASYNAGPGTVDRYGGIPPYRETQQYVQRITGLLGNLD